MPKVHRKPPPEHLVIVDTNILWDKDKKLPVSPLFDAFWAKNSPLLPMSLHVPQAVLGELYFQQTTSALKAVTSISENFQELASITASPYAHKCNETTVRNQVKAKVDRWLKSAGGVQLPTPVANIDWSTIVDAAIWRKPPFAFDPKDQKNEKGFRDAVILETVAHACSSAGVDKLIIFVCNDYLLRTTAEGRLKASKKFLAFESLADFESYIKLTQQQFTNDFVKSIQSHARAKFFTKGDVNCIYSKSEVGTRLISEFSADLEFKDPNRNALSLAARAIGSAARYAKLTKQMFLIRSTQFSKLEGDRQFHWTSRVDLARLYELEESSGLIASAIPPIRRIQLVGFDVRWKSNVKSDGRFHDIEVTALERVESEILDVTEERLEKLRLL